MDKNKSKMLIEEDIKDRQEIFKPVDQVKKEIEPDADQAPYDDHYMPDSSRHGVISSRPDLFEDDEEPLVGDGTVSEETDLYDEEDIREDDILD